ncbi:MAG TPA: UMP kinase [Candidatus Bathyarchaeota archaeon]|nr:UMP kinase [Candidatus Bathyarchaeota archaeon]
MRVTVRIGGSVVASPLNPRLIDGYASTIRVLRQAGHELAVVVGGGSISREFIKAAQEVGLNEEAQDEVAISISRVIAQMLAIRIGGLEWKRIPTTLEEAVETLRERGVVVMGGLKPGMTTDTVAALLASKIKANMIVKATDQEGIYTKDPKKHPDAEKLDELTFDELIEHLESKRHKAGIHQIIDPEAVKILRKSRIKTVVVNGFDPENIIRALEGEKIGTVIS